jgi:hypothetical protein
MSKSHSSRKVFSETRSFPSTTRAVLCSVSDTKEYLSPGANLNFSESAIATEQNIAATKQIKNLEFRIKNWQSRLPEGMAKPTTILNFKFFILNSPFF